MRGYEHVPRLYPNQPVNFIMVHSGTCVWAGKINGCLSTNKIAASLTNKRTILPPVIWLSYLKLHFRWIINYVTLCASVARFPFHIRELGRSSQLS